MTVTAAVVSTATASVSGAYLFYGDSYFDSDVTGAGGSPDDALPSDKLALQPGQTATFNNYSSYIDGINGVSIDLSGLTTAQETALGPTGLSASDFTFAEGNNNSPDGWSTDVATPTVTVYTNQAITNSVLNGSNGEFRGQPDRLCHHPAQLELVPDHRLLHPAGGGKHGGGERGIDHGPCRGRHRERRPVQREHGHRRAAPTRSLSVGSGYPHPGESRRHL